MATIEKRGNTYRITVFNGSDVNGEPIRSRTTYKPAPGMTQKQIDKELKKISVLFEQEVKNGMNAPKNIKFKEFSDQWLEEYAKGQLSPTTVRRYKQCLLRINQAIGHLKLSDITPLKLNSFYNNLQEQGIRNDIKYKLDNDITPLLKEKHLKKYELAELANIGDTTLRVCLKGDTVSPETMKSICKVLKINYKDYFAPLNGEKTLSNNTIGYHHRVISVILKTAVEWGYINNNPCDRIKPPKAEHKEANYLREDEISVLLNALDEVPILLKSLIITALFTGMRRGEILALEWCDIDFKAKTIDINKSSVYLSDLGIIDKATKTEKSKRVIKVSDYVLSTLKEYRIEQNKNRINCGDRWKNSNKVFTSAEGAKLRPEYISTKYSALAKKLNLSSTRLHELRHTNASLLISEGTNIVTVSKRLGHASTSTTGNIYAHAIQSADEKASEALNKYIPKHG